MTKEEWVDWKQHPVTKAYFEACEERVVESKELLSTSAGLDSNQDNFMRGFIHAYREMMDFRVEDIE